MMPSAELEIPPAHYAVIMIRADIDRFEHNALFARELSVGLRHHGVQVRILDYCRQAAELFAAMRDPACLFLMCFNGFGAELTVSRAGPGSMASAFTAFGKPLLDFMHDCPAHDSMRHQVEARFPHRLVLLTDYGYANVARSMGVPNVAFVPSIAFPTTVGPDVRPMRERTIRILLPIGLASPDLILARFLHSRRYKDRLYSALFEAVTATATADWRVDPLEELKRAARESGCELDFCNVDARFLLTAVLDYVKLARRRALLRAVSHLPVTVVSDRNVEQEMPGGSPVRFVPQRSSSELLRLMTDSQCVICPTPHMTGFHERALGAFTARAVVVSAPNEVVETNFVAAKEFLLFRDESELAATLEAAIGRPEDLQSIADAGHAQAMARFHPQRLAATFLSLLTTRRV
jgi:hypothetical protein